MSSVFSNINIDENDPRFTRLKDTFTEEIKKRFSCDDYDPIVNYVFTFVFESKNTKESSIKEMRELFYDKTEEIMDLLWNLTGSIYQPTTSQPNNDLLEEIYKDKNDQSKKFPSQIVNPNVEVKTQSKPLFGSAIERVRDDKKRDSRGDRNDYRGNYRNDYRNDRFDRRGGRDYYDNYRRGSDDRRRPSRREEGNVRTMQVGDKKVILRRRSDEKSKSPSPNSEKRDRSRDERDVRDGRDTRDFRDGREQRDQREMRPNDEEAVYEEREQRGYDRDMPYDNRNFYPRGAYFPLRRFGMQRGGRFAPRGMGMFMKPQFMDPRR